MQNILIFGLRPGAFLHGSSLVNVDSYRFPFFDSGVGHKPVIPFVVQSKKKIVYTFALKIA
jgi:hypothetical protein